MTVAGRTVLITGGSGYFGCVLRERLRSHGARVRIFDLHDSNDRPGDVAYQRGDVGDTEALWRACDGMELVFHNVAQVPLAKDRRLFRSVNVDGTRNLLEACRRARVQKLVHTSSSAVFGIPLRNPVDELAPLTPADPYGMAKAEAEELVSTAARDGSVDATIIRPRTILGHGRLGIFQILFRWVEEGRRIPVLGRGDNLYQFVHADDLADACVRASLRTGPAVYNIGAERFGTMRETLEALCRHAATGSSTYSVPLAPAAALMSVTSALGWSPLAPYHALMYGRSLYFDGRRAREELGWRARWSNAEMICESYDWYRRHRHEPASGEARSTHRSPVREGILGLLRRLS